MGPIVENQVLEQCIRLLLSSLCGFGIGFERKTRSKDAGVRTHTIVALGSCLLMIISKYGFADMDGKFDGARIAAQIVTGIGFLGAGMIFYRRDTLHGLTTAAGIWATAAIGMALGAGMYYISLISTVLLVGLQVFLHLKGSFFRGRMFANIKLTVVMNDDTLNRVGELFQPTKYLKVKTFIKDDKLYADLEIATKEVVEAATVQRIAAENMDWLLTVERVDDV